MALRNPWDKTQIGLILKRENRREGEKRRREEEEEEEEEKKKRRRRESMIKKGMETHLDYGFYEIWYGSLVLYGYYLASNLGFVRISS